MAQIFFTSTLFLLNSSHEWSFWLSRLNSRFVQQGKELCLGFSPICVKKPSHQVLNTQADAQYMQSFWRKEVFGTTKDCLDCPLLKLHSDTLSEVRWSHLCLWSNNCTPGKNVILCIFLCNQCSFLSWPSYHPGSHHEFWLWMEMLIKAVFLNLA